MPELTVRETFNFSNCCQGVGSNAGALHRHSACLHRCSNTVRAIALLLHEGMLLGLFEQHGQYIRISATLAGLNKSGHLDIIGLENGLQW